MSLLAKILVRFCKYTRAQTRRLPDADARYAFGRDRWIADHIDRSSGYLLRRYVFARREHAGWLAVMLHQFLSSDRDWLHDHPTDYFTLVLCGGYWEVTPKGRHWRGPGHFRFRRAEDLHRIELDPEKAGGPTFTLFAMGKRRRQQGWGFIVDGTWVRHDLHLKQFQGAVAP